MAADPIATIPDPGTVRYLIGVRAAELALLRQLLRLAESRGRLLKCVDSNRQAVDPTHQ